MASTTASNALLSETIDTLWQLADFVAGLPPEQYAAPHGVDARHSVGKHVRHVLDHYQAFLNWVETTTATTLDYEYRERNPELEQDPDKALVHMRRLIERLEQVDAFDTSTRLVHLRYQAGDQDWPLTSSLERELTFMTSHAIHHMAIIALLADSQGIETPQTFGVHPSTLRHWQHTSQPVHEVRS
ncbi:DinB family protein [Chromohalobacter nigrandesensis]|uniref:DinB family protein n=1 Tax=Chromohalobacter nigrandesensis TaxID=119863 RepID=UPI001FF27CE6|nr:DinB family protein [Chromohalobacter nigrandesensis]MCK0746000.1 DinB family protein [Chromohalobacter nigrandesensis]